MIAPFCVDGAAAEPLAGTAPHRPVWALVEHPGPWGREAVLDAPWPDDAFGPALQARLDAAGVRVVLARRPGTGERGAPDAPHVVLGRYDGPRWTATTQLPDVAALADLDWAALAASDGRPDGWADPGPVWGVCTHGTRDACCARLGRPLAAAFEALVPTGTWEISHSGGHRFAGVAFDVTRGLLHGRVGPDDVPALVAAQAAGRVVRHLLRGSVAAAPAVQAAEAVLRDRLEEDDAAALALLPAATAVGAAPPDDAVATSWRHAPTGSHWDVVVAQMPLAPRPASCGKAAEPASAWTALSVTPRD